MGQPRLFGSYNWTQFRLWGPASMLLYVINHLLSCIWTSLLQRRRPLQAYQGTSWGEGRADLRRKACKWPWTQGFCFSGLEGTHVENGGLAKWKTHKESAQGQKLAPGFKTLLAFALLLLLYLCSKQPSWGQTSPLLQTGRLEIFWIPKALGVMGDKQPSILGSQLLTWVTADHAEVVVPIGKVSWVFPDESWGSPLETTCSVPLWLLVLLMVVAVTLNPDGDLSMAWRQFLGTSCPKATDEHFYSLKLNTPSFLLGELPSLKSWIYWLLTFTWEFMAVINYVSYFPSLE